jgi:hypothetical protein
MEITGVYTIHFLIDGRDMEAPFIVTPEASSNIIGMNVIRTYKLNMDVLTTTVTVLLAHFASLQTSEEYDVKVHTDINVDAGMSHLTKLFLAVKESGKRLFGKHQFMVTVGPLAVATVSDRNITHITHGVFELFYPIQQTVTFSTKGTTRLGKQTRNSTGHPLPNRRWEIGQNRKQQRPAATRSRETSTITDHTRQKTRRRSSTRWMTGSEKRTFPTSRGQSINKCCTACRQLSVQTRWISEEQTLWKVTLTSETRNQCTHSNSD